MIMNIDTRCKRERKAATKEKTPNATCASRLSTRFTLQKRHSLGRERKGKIKS